TRMDTVLGRAAGNAVEVQESLDVLGGGGPADLIEVTVALAREMIDLAGIDADPAEVLASGAARPVFDAMVAGQGGDIGAGLPEAEHNHVVTADRAGWITRLDSRSVGIAAWRLGAGRARKEDPVSPVAGIVCLKKPGEAVEAGEAVLELRTEEPGRFDGARAALAGAMSIEDAPVEPEPLIVERITA
ncbi:MAG: thymidine phosphorylase, partial [Acidimicrobiales bacterium]